MHDQYWNRTRGYGLFYPSPFPSIFVRNTYIQSVSLGPYRTCPWHFKYLNKVGRVELVPTFATIRFWHRTTTEHVQTFCSQLSKHSFARRANVMLPRSFLLRAAAFLLETFQLNNDCSGFWGRFPSLNSAAGKCFGRTNALNGMIRQLRSRRRPQYFWIPPWPHTPGPRGFLLATARIVSWIRNARQPFW